MTIEYAVCSGVDLMFGHPLESSKTGKFAGFTFKDMNGNYVTNVVAPKGTFELGANYCINMDSVSGLSIKRK